MRKTIDSMLNIFTVIHWHEKPVLTALIECLQDNKTTTKDHRDRPPPPASVKSAFT